MREIGIHIRLKSTLQDAALKAQRLGVPFFQCFLVRQGTGRLIRPSQEDIDQFLTLRRLYFDKIFLHGSYWINLAGIDYTGERVLHRELHLAKKLEFTHIILHPGSAKGAKDKLEGIDALARALNKLSKEENEIQFVLENTAHGRLSVGGDLQDFAQLREKLDHPEKIQYCIDTAHAYSYGYDVSTVDGVSNFVTVIDKTIGCQNVVLIHLNDTTQKLGSKIDRHEMVGDGNIGTDALRAFVNNKKLHSIPILLELPVISEKKEEDQLNLVRVWDSE